MSGLVPDSLLITEEARKRCMTPHLLATDDKGGGSGVGGREGGLTSRYSNSAQMPTGKAAREMALQNPWTTISCDQANVSQRSY